jgi:hypothetical protein
MALLNNLLGKGKAEAGDVEYWHGPERSGWLMKQGRPKPFLPQKRLLFVLH